MNITFEPWHLWTIGALCLLIGEVFLPGFLLASLGAGCLIAAGVHYLSGDMAYALGGFVLGAGVSLALVRPYFAIVFGPEEQSQFGPDAMIGDVVEVTDASDVGGSLKARYRDSSWSLRCDKDLFEGDKAKIVAVDGGVLVVTPVSED